MNDGLFCEDIQSSEVDINQLINSRTDPGTLLYLYYQASLDRLNDALSRWADHVIVIRMQYFERNRARFRVYSRAGINMCRTSSVRFDGNILGASRLIGLSTIAIRNYAQ
jgi:hypothetical protein